MVIIKKDVLAERNTIAITAETAVAAARARVTGVNS